LRSKLFWSSHNLACKPQTRRIWQALRGEECVAGRYRHVCFTVTCPTTTYIQQTFVTWMIQGYDAGVPCTQWIDVSMIPGMLDSMRTRCRSGGYLSMLVRPFFESSVSSRFPFAASFRCSFSKHRPTHFLPFVPYDSRFSFLIHLPIACNGQDLVR
jgi:hypothetical protein